PVALARVTHSNKSTGGRNGSSSRLFGWVAGAVGARLALSGSGAAFWLWPPALLHRLRLRGDHPAHLRRAGLLGARRHQLGPPHPARAAVGILSFIAITMAARCATPRRHELSSLLSVFTLCRAPDFPGHSAGRLSLGPGATGKPTTRPGRPAAVSAGP